MLLVSLRARRAVRASVRGKAAYALGSYAACAPDRPTRGDAARSRATAASLKVFEPRFIFGPDLERHTDAGRILAIRRISP
ncbi:hypothetical protein [Aureimonas sp. N4]|uniref:hypothetical protein n=1 Tax=Aureimonas sp. N4 TaxID=1638165 RepID=UPI0012E3487E|nr:hypothetical protein [Aureimonas sp. N4]